MRPSAVRGRGFLRGSRLGTSNGRFELLPRPYSEQLSVKLDLKFALDDLVAPPAPRARPRLGCCRLGKDGEVHLSFDRAGVIVAGDETFVVD